MRFETTFLLTMLLVVMLGGMATYQIMSYVKLVHHTTQEIERNLNKFIAQENEKTNVLLTNNMNKLIDLVENLSSELEFLKQQQIQPVYNIMKDVLLRESDIVRLLDHLPLLIKPLDYSTVSIPASDPNNLITTTTVQSEAQQATFKVSHLTSQPQPRQTISAELYATTLDILSKNSPKTIVDVNGNIGTFGLLAASVGYHVYAFEPTPSYSEKYAEGVVINSFQELVRIYPIAVHSSSAGKAVIASKDSTTSSEGKLMVQLGKIDDYVPINEEILILKLSAQSLDMEVIHGAQRAIQSTKFIFFEIDRNDVIKLDSTRIATLLSYLDSSLSFQLYRRWKDPNSRIVNFKEFANFMLSPSSSLNIFNIYCVKKGSVTWAQ